MLSKEIKILGLAALFAFGMALEASAEKIVLENGDQIDVEIVEELDGKKIVEHPQLGRMEIPNSAIKPPEPPEPEVPGLFGSRVLRGWEKNLGFGFSGSEGVAQDLSLNVSLDFKREADSYRGAFNSAYFFSQASPDQTVSSQTETTNEGFAQYQHDFLFGESRFFIFGKGRYDYNDFQAYLHRPGGYAGAGYDFIKREKLRLTGEVGGGASYSFGTIDDVAGEGIVALDFAWKVLEGHEFVWDITYYPNFSDTPNFRILANAAYSIGLLGIEGLALKVGVQEEFNYEVPDVQVFNSDPASFTDGERNSLKYFGNLTYDF